MTSRCSFGVTFIGESCQGMRKLQNCKAAGDNRAVELWWRGINRLFDGAHTNCIVVCSNLIRIKPPLKLYSCRICCMWTVCPCCNDPERSTALFDIMDRVCIKCSILI